MAIADDEVSGIKIKAGQVVINNVYGAHRNELNFDSPHVFDPTRYLARRTSTNFAFGGGPHVCGLPLGHDGVAAYHRPFVWFVSFRQNPTAAP